MKMPKTYFDFIQVLRPELLDFVKKDVNYLKSINRDTPIVSVDEYTPNGLQECLINSENKVIESAANSLNIPVHIVKQYIKNDKAFNHQLFALKQSVNYDFHSCLNFLLSGQKTFFFSDVISQKLVHTEIHIPAVEIQLPFFTCQLVFTEKEVIDAFYAKAILDNPDLKIDYSCPISVFVTLFDNCDNLDGRRIIFNSYHYKFPHEIFLMQKRELFLGNNWNLEQSLKTDWEKLTPDNLGLGTIFNQNDNTIVKSEDNIFYTDGLLFYRIVLNAILYINSIKADQSEQISDFKKLQKKLKREKSHLKKEKIISDLQKISVLDYTAIGFNEQSIVLKKSDGSEEDLDYPKLNVLDKRIFHRFMVRGHWRNQRYGVGLSETKLIWIKPYIKGDDLSEIINKPYIIKE